MSPGTSADRTDTRADAGRARAVKSAPTAPKRATPTGKKAAGKATSKTTAKPRGVGRGDAEGIFAGYSKGPYANAFDEMFDDNSEVRSPYRGLLRALAPSEWDDLETRVDALGRAFVDQGITFSLSGQERPFPLDVVPRVISAGEWAKLERGITQRVQALEMFLDDIYGEQEILRDGVVPKRLITSCEHFHRQAVGINPPNGVRIHVAGIDLIRDEQGDFRVLEDNLRSPSGVSYVMENRRTMARVFPDLFASQRVRAVADYSSQLLAALRASAAFNEADPNVVVLTPGVANSAYFEHSLLARQMGVELVEGRDLFCRDNVVYMRTTEGEQRVDVIYRRIDDDYLDPMAFRPDSMLGVAGLLNAARAGNVVISSAVGNGVGDDKLVYTYVPEIIEYYLGEKPSLANVDTLRCWLDDEREEVLDRIDELVVKPVEGSGGYGIVFGPDSTKEELDTLARKVRHDPRGWIAQPVVQLSTVPTKVGDRMAPRHVDLRPFAVNDGESVWVLPGGLTRVALPEGSLVVNSSQGGGSKDTWVLASRASAGDRELSGEELVSTKDLPPAHQTEQGPEQAAGQQQQQQQQQQRSEPFGTMGDVR
ncbi:circularly permuted type 2 ATP-grasp protein [Williamsia sp. CHRR-6]|uniref:circularly permuted type 2 ATP-grasp protein n=1 Tax=Williamsia sp. CHRR-6 TaxID=2835871 RepID=UPI001BD979C1|nr:circularly permuted type 2 ATP-grasp protein [Williamsia sp. CHRR-6]MBT0565408.1 circularly permuted type 2 ATP-grasp protein [Williamsia sp. CHRR-6]